MQAEFDLALGPISIGILGVNAAHEEADNALMCAGRTLPWLQDADVSDVWGLWEAGYRDVVVLDPQGVVFAIYNLTSHDLANPVNYAELKAILSDAATP